LGADDGLDLVEGKELVDRVDDLADFDLALADRLAAAPEMSSQVMRIPFRQFVLSDFQDDAGGAPLRRLV
jgi:hypothetical protein